MHLWHLNNMKLTSHFEHSTILIVFFCISLVFTIEPNNLEKSYSPINKKHDQTCVFQTFDFIS